MITRLPPTRRAVPLWPSRAHASALHKNFPGFRAHLFQSGTASLAAALFDAKAAAGKTLAEVVIPAYGCPDLVTACVCAGVQPRLVDVEADAWGYRLGELRAALNDRTIAIVAVNLLGVGDQGAELSALTRERGIALIQDSAQYLPDLATVNWAGDYVVLSFGRGKPLNLMQGGALLARAERDESIGAVGAALHGKQRLKYAVLASAVAALAFNTMSSPDIYGLIARLPGLGLGATRYRVLDSCKRMPASFAKKALGAFDDYAAEANYRLTSWRAVLSNWEALGVRQLRSVAAREQDDGQRLRLPLLASAPDVRDRLVAALEDFGASALYGAPLNRITDIPEQVREQGPFPGATALADRLFTLPTHEFVTESVARRADAILMRMLDRR